MRYGRGLAAAAALLALSMTAAADEQGIHPYRISPCEPAPGRTGFGTPEIDALLAKVEAARQAGGDEAADEAVRKDLDSEAVRWGYPEFQPYPGSAEHCRHAQQRYLPGYPLYNQNTLVKNVILRDLPACRDACVDFAEPVYWHTQWRKRIVTSKRRAVGKVYPWKPGAPAIALDLGRLESRMMYAVRVVGALPTADLPAPAVTRPDDGSPRKQLVFRLDVNDGPGGKVNGYILRGRANDNFYQVVAFFFHAVDDRDVRIALTLLPESEATLYTYNIDVHNIFGECARRAGKKAAVTWNPARRVAVREQTLGKFGAAGADLHDTLWKQGFDDNALKPAAARAAAATLPTPDPARDEAIWQSLPPLNSTWDDRTAASAAAGWSTRQNMRTWDQPFAMRRGGQLYSAADLAAHKPLPGVGDAGYGVLLETPVPGQGNRPRRVLSPIGFAAYWKCYYAGDALKHLTWAYENLGDQQSARDGALLLARVAWALPALQPNDTLSYADGGSPESMPRRYASGNDPPHGWGPLEPRALLRYYDTLFDYIQDNRELAAAIGRFVPWVETPDDVRWLFDVYLVQYVANEMLHYRYYYDHGFAQMVIEAAAIQNDNDISRPWMEFLWRQSWEYPQSIAGLADNIVTNTTRDGTTTIGSWSYTMSGNAGLDVAAELRPYLGHGGDRKYDLTDFRRYPKSPAGITFFFESCAAGGHYPGIGDVGGPSRPFRGSKLAGAMDDHVRDGWRLTHDTRLAWFLAHDLGRKGETDAEWAAIKRAAAGRRNPYLEMRSRVLSDWSGYLETGLEHDDFRFRRALAVRVGNGVGHAHDDTLDLRLWAFGSTMLGDLGQRSAYGRPRHFTSYVHNVVEVDGDGAGAGEWNGYAWVPNLFDAPGARYLAAQSTPPANHRDVKLFRRQVALIDVDEGMPDGHVVRLPRSYVFDVFRVSGGRIHTYCFHGCVDGGFEVNIKDRVFLDENGESADEKYMRAFRWTRVGEQLSGKPVPDDDKQWAADPAGDVLVATWRLGLGAEKRMVTAAGAMTAARKFTRLHLFDVAGARILHGICADMNGSNRLNPDVPHYAGRCLFAQKRGGGPRDDVFVALIEPYAGEPFISASRPLAVEDNEADAQRAVALEVTPAAGRRDLCFADGRPEKVRRVVLPEGGRVEIAGEYAFLSTDAQGLRAATVANGRRLFLPGVIALEPAETAYRGRVVAVDCLDRTVTLDGILPARFAGDVVEIGNDDHRTSFAVDRIERRGEQTVLHLRKGLEIMCSRVVERDAARGTLKTQLAMIHLPGRDRGLVASNESLTKFWRLAFLGGSRHEGYDFQLTRTDGAAAPVFGADDFKLGDGLRVWEFGVGDRVVRRTGVALRRAGEPGVYEVLATTPFRAGLAGAAVALSADGKTWRPLSVRRAGDLVEATVDEDDLGAGRFYLRVAGP